MGFGGVGTSPGHYVVAPSEGRLYGKSDRLVDRLVQGPDSLLGCPTGTFRVRFRLGHRHGGVTVGLFRKVRWGPVGSSIFGCRTWTLFGTPGTNRLYVGPVDSSVHRYKSRTLCRSVRRGPSVGLVQSTRHTDVGSGLFVRVPGEVLCVEGRSVRRNTETTFGFIVEVSEADLLYKGPVGSSTRGHRSQTLCHGVR